MSEIMIKGLANINNSESNIVIMLLKSSEELWKVLMEKPELLDSIKQELINCKQSQMNSERSKRFSM